MSYRVSLVEQYERPRWWWVGSFCMLALLLWLIISTGDWRGLLFFVIVVGGYIYYDLTQRRKTVILRITPAGLYHDDRLTTRDHISGCFIQARDYDLEEPLHLVLLEEDNVLVHTFLDDILERHECMHKLSKYTQILSQDPLSGSKKLLRMLRI